MCNVSLQTQLSVHYRAEPLHITHGNITHGVIRRRRLVRRLDRSKATTGRNVMLIGAIMEHSHLNSIPSKLQIQMQIQAQMKYKYISRGQKVVLIGAIMEHSHLRNTPSKYKYKYKDKHKHRYKYTGHKLISIGASVEHLHLTSTPNPMS